MWLFGRGLRCSVGVGIRDWDEEEENEEVETKKKTLQWWELSGVHDCISHQLQRLFGSHQ